MDLRPILDALRRGDARGARARCEALVAGGTDHVQLRTLLARAHLALGDAVAARAALDAALRLDRNFAPTWIELAQLANRERRSGEAAAALREATRLAPQVAALWLDRGELELALGNADVANACFANARRLAPTERRAIDGLARSAEALGNVDDEIRARRELADAMPHDLAGQLALGDALRRDDRNEEAQAAFGAALALGATDPLVEWLRWQALPLVHRDADHARETLAAWQAGLAAMEQRIATDAPAAERALALLSSATNFQRHYLGEPLLGDQVRYGKLLRALARIARPGLADPRPPRSGAARLRVAFVSSHFHAHTVLKYFGGWLTGLDRARFETVVVHLDPLEDAETARIRGAVDAFAGGFPTVAHAIEAVRELRPDVLVHLDVGMHPWSQALAALRLAPVQAATWGHPVTTGLDTIDAYLSSDWMEPADGERHYSERLVRLPRLGVRYAAPTTTPRTPPLPLASGLSGYFLCPQSAPKLLPEHDALFARVAAACPAHAIVLIPHAKAHVRADLEQRIARAFRDAGADAERQLVVLPHQPHDSFLGIARDAVAMLDSLHFSGGNTTLETLAVGLPPITLPGATMRSRQSATMLGQMGLRAWVVHDPESYVATAQRLTQPKERAALSGEIAARRDVLYGDDAPVRGLEAWLDAQRDA